MKRESRIDLIAQKAKVSPNTIKVLASRAGIDESASIHSRAFELFSEGKTPLQVAITLNLEAEQAIQYHQQYFMLLGCTEFTKVYLQIKDNPWPYVNLVRLVQKARIGEGEVVELIKIANGYLPRIRLEYDRLIEEKNSMKVELQNTVRIYQDFCDRNLALKKREDELQQIIDAMENKKTELQKTTGELQQQLSVLQEFNVGDNTLDLEIRQGEFVSMNDVFIPPPNMVIDYQTSENEILHYPFQVEPSSRTLNFDTRELFPTKAQT